MIKNLLRNNLIKTNFESYNNIAIKHIKANA